MLLPSEGVCHGCYILAYCAGLDQPPSFSELIARARRLSCGESFYRDLRGLTHFLLEAGIAYENEGRIRFIEEFPECRAGADRNTKVQIAKILLRRSRPDWLPTAGDSDRIVDALMPIGAQNALSWLGADLTHVLHSTLIPQDRHFTSEALGRIGEEVILAAERNAGRRVRHVSPISDSYGYDIESESAGETLCIEVKCTIEQRSGGFFLSRNEYEQSSRLGSRWMLVQVVLWSEPAWTAETLDIDSVMSIRFVSDGVISREIVADNHNCRWQESVEFRLPDQTWISYPHVPHVGWSMVNPLVSTAGANPTASNEITESRDAGDEGPGPSNEPSGDVG